MLPQSLPMGPGGRDAQRGARRRRLPLPLAVLYSTEGERRQISSERRRSSCLY